MERKDAERHHDSWLSGVTKADVRKAAEMHQRQLDAERKREEAERKRPKGDKHTLMQQLLRFLRPGETVVSVRSSFQFMVNILQALKRCGGGKKPRMTNQQMKRKQATAMDTPTAAVPSPLILL